MMVSWHEMTILMYGGPTLHQQVKEKSPSDLIRTGDDSLVFLSLAYSYSDLRSKVLSRGIPKLKLYFVNNTFSIFLQL